MTHGCGSPADVSVRGYWSCVRPTHRPQSGSCCCPRWPDACPPNSRRSMPPRRRTLLTPWRALSAPPGPSVRPGEWRQRSGDSHDLVWIDHQIQNLVPWADVAPRMARQRPRRLIIRLIIQTIRRDRTGAVWTDEAPNVSRPDPTGADQTDAEHQATDLAVGGSNPSRRAIFPVQHGSSRRSSPSAFLAVAILECQARKRAPGRKRAR